MFYNFLAKMFINFIFVLLVKIRIFTNLVTEDLAKNKNSVLIFSTAYCQIFQVCIKGWNHNYVAT